MHFPSSPKVRFMGVDVLVAKPALVAVAVLACCAAVTMIGGEDRQCQGHFSPTGGLRIKVTVLAPARLR